MKFANKQYSLELNHRCRYKKIESHVFVETHPPHIFWQLCCWFEHHLTAFVELTPAGWKAAVATAGMYWEVAEVIVAEMNDVQAGA